MENYLIIAIIAVAAGFGIYFTVKHFQGQGGCCGGGDYKPKKKRLKNILYKKTFKVDGMHCAHCQNRVEEAINDIQGVAGKVNLKKSTLTVCYEQDVADGLILSKIERIGYKITK